LYNQAVHLAFGYLIETNSFPNQKSINDFDKRLIGF
jgi:hypothetical protein